MVCSSQRFVPYPVSFSKPPGTLQCKPRFYNHTRYDANGNRTSSHLHGAGYRTGPGNQLLSDGTFNYTYDHEGNMVTKTRITPVDGEVNFTEFEYDFRNRMTKITQYSKHPAEGGIILHEQSNRYDALGRRISVAAAADGTSLAESTLILTVYNTEDAWADFGASAELHARYLLGARTDHMVAILRSGENVLWYLNTLLRTVRDLVDSTGQQVGHVRYHGFGQPILMSQSMLSNRFLFTSREFDPNIALYYYRARFYDPTNGRFVSQDPLRHNAGDTNLQRYVGNSPFNATDPTGTMAMTSYTIFLLHDLLSIARTLNWAHNEFPRMMEEIKQGGVDCERYRSFGVDDLIGDPPFLTYLMTYLMCRIFVGLQSVGLY